MASTLKVSVRGAGVMADLRLLPVNGGVEGPPLPPTKGSDATVSWALPDDVPLFRLQVAIDRPSWATPKSEPWTEVNQDFERGERTAQNPSGLRAANPEPRKLHPRLTESRATTVGNVGGEAISVVVDMRFIDCTALLRETKRLEGPLDDAATAIDEDERHPDASTRLLAYTNGAPLFWAITFSKAQIGRGRTAKLHFCFFFRPRDAAYTDGSNVSLAAVARYFLGRNDPVAPFFVRSNRPDRPLLADVPSVTTRCGFAAQLVKSGKPVVLVSPIAPGGAYGDALSLESKEIATGLRRCLEAHGLVGGGAPLRDEDTRLALAGFSAGAGGALGALNASARIIDEFYWFDPPGPVVTSEQGGKRFEAWFRASGAVARPRFLRFVGALAHLDLLRRETDLRRVAPPNMTISSLTGPNYYESSEMYVAATCVPIQTLAPPTPFPEQLDAPGVSPSQPLTVESGVFATFSHAPALGPQGHRTPIVTVSLAGGRGIPIQNVTLAVAAGFLRFHHRSPVPDPGDPLAAVRDIAIRNQAELGQFATHLSNAVNDDGGFRHQWCVVGCDLPAGQKVADPSNPSRAGTTGFLERCIKEGFP